MKNVEKFIEYINKSLVGKYRLDLDFFYKKILPCDKTLTIDEAIEVVNSCPGLVTVLKSIDSNNTLVNNTSLYNAYKLVVNAKDVVEVDMNMYNRADEVYYTNFNVAALFSSHKDVDIFKLYLADVTAFPLLNIKEINQLFARMENGDETAKDKILCHNLRLPVSIAKTYQILTGAYLPDLVQEGNIGLMRAIEKYNYRLGYTFSTYAICWVKQAIARYIADNGLTVRIPVHVREKINKIRKYVERYISINNEDPTKEEVMKTMDISEDVYDLYSLVNTNSFVLSLDMPVKGVGDESGDVSLGDFIPADEVNFDEKVVDRMAKETFYDTLIECGLTPRELQIIKLRYGLEDGRVHTLAEVGKQFDVTRERVRQIEVRAINKLRRGKNLSKLIQYREDYGTKEEENPWTLGLRK